MRHCCETSGSAGGRQAILMARFVGATGRAIEPAIVRSVEYRIHELDAGVRTGGWAAPREAVALKVGDVLFDALQQSDLWQVDGVGYNFRHDFAIARNEDGAGTHYQVRYELVFVSGHTTTIAFQVGTSLK